MEADNYGSVGSNGCCCCSGSFKGISGTGGLVLSNGSTGGSCGFWEISGIGGGRKTGVCGSGSKDGG